MKIDLGCGISKKAGFVGVDRLALPGVDVRHDLSVLPYPFADNVADEIWMDIVLEHLPDPLRVMEEVWRICAHGATVHVGVPYFRSFYAIIDPTHRNYFGVHWFNYFDPRHPFHAKYSYTIAQFRVEKILFDRELRAGGVGSPLNRMVRWFAQRYPQTYEGRLSHLYPLNSLTFTLQAQKHLQQDHASGNKSGVE